MNFKKHKELNAKSYHITMEDGSVWSIPVMVIALNRASYYSEADGVSLDDSMDGDTVPLFLADPLEIEDWAKNNMDWEDVAADAQCIQGASIDFEDGWCNGEAEVV
jgi:hypothetical protein